MGADATTGGSTSTASIGTTTGASTLRQRRNPVRCWMHEEVGVGFDDGGFEAWTASYP